MGSCSKQQLPYSKPQLKALARKYSGRSPVSLNLLFLDAGSIIGNHSHWTARCISTKVDANNLANLRKQTGYGLSLCREALLENGNDLKAADEWLREQATKKGWQKAEKLQQRKAAEGLIGVLVEDNHAAMVEVSF